jgi:hypothetical protein
VADRHASVIDGSLNFVQMRVLVPDDREAEARELLTEAELGEWLRSEPFALRERRLGAGASYAAAA